MTPLSSHSSLWRNRRLATIAVRKVLQRGGGSPCVVVRSVSSNASHSGKASASSQAATTKAIILPLQRPLSSIASVRISPLPLPPLPRIPTMPSPAVVDEQAVGDIEDYMALHERALEQGKTTYQDPATGFTVFTELLHLKRGTCCGNSCRHCPYGYENVPLQNQTPAMRATPSKVVLLPMDDDESQTNTDTRATAKAMAQSILNMAANSSTTTRTTTAKNVPYTRTGDQGTSQLGTGERRSKDDCNFEALGTVDELCSVVGLVHAYLNDKRNNTNNVSSSNINNNNNNKLDAVSTQLLDIMSRLFDIGSHVAKPSTNFEANGIGGGFDAHHIEDLESWINEMTNALPELTSFILPTGSPAAAQLHVARTVCRRAERRMVPLVTDHETCDPNALKYLNRLSDYFFTAARFVNACQEYPEIQYQRTNSSTKQRQRVSRSLQHDD